MAKRKSFQLDTGPVNPYEILGLLLLLLWIGFNVFRLGGIDWLLGKELDKDKALKMAENEEAHYRRMGDEKSEIDKCIQASFVANALLQAAEQAKYEEWKKIEDGHCRAARVQ